ncbi:hypothetical protein EJ08DRAFT_703765 [Tothia fuscella]|uniref:Uncharacterized protein n=1 Tax=Tothia fuscella TaxID=1048955 RepID=A0A9P4TRB6_9PEZI|nr:hypothetical protein EJ08DRAFT_703765 [Tothia fuscella]
MPYGRGGAGNWEQQEQAKRKAAEDLEAARSQSSQSTTTTTTTPTVSQSQPQNAPSITSTSNQEPSQTTPQDYAHMGRGGAGNWFSPKELSTTGTFITPTDPTTSTKADKSTEAEIVTETRHRGRGGAGNFIWSQEEEERRKRGEETKEIELKDMVARDVEMGLQRPGKAVLRNEGRELEISGYV